MSDRDKKGRSQMIMLNKFLNAHPSKLHPRKATFQVVQTLGYWQLIVKANRCYSVFAKKGK